MKTIKPTQSFATLTGSYRPGHEYEVSDEFADDIVGAGHAVMVRSDAEIAADVAAEAEAAEKAEAEAAEKAEAEAAAKAKAEAEAKPAKKTPAKKTAAKVEKASEPVADSTETATAEA